MLGKLRNPYFESLVLLSTLMLLGQLFQITDASPTKNDETLLQHGYGTSNESYPNEKAVQVQAETPTKTSNKDNSTSVHDQDDSLHPTFLTKLTKPSVSNTSCHINNAADDLISNYEILFSSEPPFLPQSLLPEIKRRLSALSNDSTPSKDLPKIPMPSNGLKIAKLGHSLFRSESSHANSDALHSSLRDNIRDHALLRREIIDLEEAASNRINGVHERISKLVAGKIQRIVNILLKNEANIKENAAAAEVKRSDILTEAQSSFQAAAKGRDDILKCIDELRSEFRSFKVAHYKELNDHRAQTAQDKREITKTTDDLFKTIRDVERIVNTNRMSQNGSPSNRLAASGSGFVATSEDEAFTSTLLN